MKCSDLENFQEDFESKKETPYENIWEEYTLRKYELISQNLAPKDYEREIRKIVEVLEI